MNSVNIAELKNNLSRYLELVKAGKEIIIRDRSLPVARLAPLRGSEAPGDELQRLAAQGKIRLGEENIDDAYWKLKFPKGKAGNNKNLLQRVIDEERDGD